MRPLELTPNGMLWRRNEQEMQELAELLEVDLGTLRLDETLRALRATTVPRPRGRRLEIVPLERWEANAFLEAVHELGRVAGDRYRVGLADELGLVGAIVAGRPSAPALAADPEVIEITRLGLLEGLESDSNAASRLIGRACRVAASLGFRRAVTYLGAGRHGGAFRAAGFEVVAATAGGEWSRRGRRRRRARDSRPKLRLERRVA